MKKRLMFLWPQSLSSLLLYCLLYPLLYPEFSNPTIVAPSDKAHIVQVFPANTPTLNLVPSADVVVQDHPPHSPADLSLLINKLQAGELASVM